MMSSNNIPVVVERKQETSLDCISYHDGSVKREREEKVIIVNKSNNEIKSEPITNKWSIMQLKEGLPLRIEKSARMMEKMGYKGGPLGLRGEGITEAIMPALQFVNRAGFGYSRSKKPVKKLNINNQIVKPKGNKYVYKKKKKHIYQDQVLTAAIQLVTTEIGQMTVPYNLRHKENKKYVEYVLEIVNDVHRIDSLLAYHNDLNLVIQLREAIKCSLWAIQGYIYENLWIFKKVPKEKTNETLAQPNNPPKDNATAPKQIAVQNTTSSKHVAVQNTTPSKHETVKNTAPPKHETVQNTPPIKHETVKNTAPPKHETVQNTNPPKHVAVQNTTLPNHDTTKNNVFIVHITDKKLDFYVNYLYVPKVEGYPETCSHGLAFRLMILDNIMEFCKRNQKTFAIDLGVKVYNNESEFIYNLMGQAVKNMPLFETVLEDYIYDKVAYIMRCSMFYLDIEYMSERRIMISKVVDNPINRVRSKELLKNYEESDYNIKKPSDIKVLTENNQVNVVLESEDDDDVVIIETVNETIILSDDEDDKSENLNIIGKEIEPITIKEDVKVDEKLNINKEKVEISSSCEDSCSSELAVNIGTKIVPINEENNKSENVSTVNKEIASITVDKEVKEKENLSNEKEQVEISENSKTSEVAVNINITVEQSNEDDNPENVTMVQEDSTEKAVKINEEHKVDREKLEICENTEITEVVDKMIDKSDNEAEKLENLSRVNKESESIVETEVKVDEELKITKEKVKTSGNMETFQISENLRTINEQIESIAVENPVKVIEELKINRDKVNTLYTTQISETVEKIIVTIGKSDKEADKLENLCTINKEEESITVETEEKVNEKLKLAKENLKIPGNIETSKLIDSKIEKSHEKDEKSEKTGTVNKEIDSVAVINETIVSEEVKIDKGKVETSGNTDPSKIADNIDAKIDKNNSSKSDFEPEKDLKKIDQFVKGDETKVCAAKESDSNLPLSRKRSSTDSESHDSKKYKVNIDDIDT